MHAKGLAPFEPPNDGPQDSKGLRVMIAFGWALTATLSMFAILGAAAMIVLQHPKLAQALLTRQ